MRTLCYLLITLILFQSSLSAFAYCDPIQNRKFQIGDVRKNVFYGSTFWHANRGKFRMQLWFYIPIADKHADNIPIYQWGDPDKRTDKNIGGIKLKYNDNKNLTVDLQLYGCTNLACVSGDYAGLIKKSFPNITKGEWHFLSIAVDGSHTRGPWWKPWTWEWYTSAEIRVDRELYRQDPYLGGFGAWNPYYNYAWLYNFITFGLYGWLTDDYYDYHRVTPLSDTHTLFYDNVLWCTQRYNDRRCHDDEDYNLDACAYPGKINYCSIAISSKPLSCTEAEVTVVVDEIEAGRRARDFHNPYGHGFWYHLLFSIYYSIDNVFDNIFGRYELHHRHSYDRWEKHRRKNTYHLIDLGSSASDVTWNGLTNNFYFYNQNTLTPTRTPIIANETNVSYGVSPPGLANYNYLSFTQSNGMNNDAEFKFKVTKQASAAFNSIYVMARHTAADGFNMPEGMHQKSTEVKFSNTQAMNMTFGSTATTLYSASDDNTALISGDERPITMTATAGFSATGQNTTQSCGTSITDTSYTGPKKLQFNLKYVVPTTAPQPLRLSLGETNKTTYSIVADKWTPVDLNFSAGVLTSKLSVQYNDVGKISLVVKEGDKILGEMPLTVMPYDFKVVGVNYELSTEYIATTLAKDKKEKIKAGAPFTVKVQAYNLLGGETPSFTKAATVNDYPALKSNYVDGGTGCAKDTPDCTPDLTYTAPQNDSFTYTNVTWEQVGYVGMSAERPAQFLGVNYPEKLKTVKPSVPVIVGRFIPDHFDVTASQPPSYKFACNNFTYRGQPFSVNPYTLTITPKSVQGNTTTGYRGDWQKLTVGNNINSTMRTANASSIINSSSSYTPITNGAFWNIAEGIYPDKTYDPTIQGPDANTSFTLTQNNNTKMLFNRPVPTENGGEAAIELAINTKINHTVFVCDDDKVTVINAADNNVCKTYNFDGGFVSAGKIYHGRTVLKDRATGNNEDRTLEVQIQKFENRSWQPNFDDSTCTKATNLRLEPSTIKNPPPSTESQPLSWDYKTPINGNVKMITMTVNGSGGPTFNIPITLTPKEGDQGKPIGLRIYLNTISVPWLQYDSFIDLNYPFAPGNDANRIQLTQ